MVVCSSLFTSGWKQRRRIARWAVHGGDYRSAAFGDVFKKYHLLCAFFAQDDVVIVVLVVLQNKEEEEILVG